MKRVLVSSAIASAMAFTSLSATASDDGFYAGASLGQTKVDFEEVAGAVVTDDKDTSWKLFAGYNVNQNLAIELAYHDFGNASATVLGLDTDIEADGYSISALGKLPVTDQTAIFGRLGYASVDAKASVAGLNIAAVDSAAIFGLGVDYSLTENVHIRAEWERIQTADTLSTFSAGVAYQF